MNHKVIQFLACGFLGTILLLVPARWDLWQFILLAAFPVVAFAYLLLNSGNSKLIFVRMDLCWLVFIALGFLSYFWATNGSLIWEPAFGWLCMILWMFLFRTIYSHVYGTVILSKLFLFLFVLGALEFFFVFADTGLSGPTDWVKYFKYNSNNTAIYFLCLYPFIIFQKKKSASNTYVKLICTFFIIFMLYIAKSHGATLAFILPIIYYLWVHYRRKLFWFVFFAFSLSFIGLYIVFAVKFDTTFPGKVLTYLGMSGVATRIYFLQSSFWLFLEHPFSGVGLGNWILMAYKYGVGGVYPLNLPYTVLRLHNHNLFTLILSELGILGFLAFTLPLAKIIWRGWMRAEELTDLHKAAFVLLMIYLFSSLIYSGANFYPEYFSGTQLLAFCAIGLLSGNTQAGTSRSKVITVILWLLSLTSLVWFIYLRISFKKTRKAELAFKYSSTAEAIRQNESMYHPVFKTANWGRYSIDHRLAGLYQRPDIRLYVKSEEYYQRALTLFPYDEILMRDYAKYLLRIRRNTKKAKEIALKLYSIQSTYFEVNLIMAEIAIKEKKYTLAKKYLSYFENEEVTRYGKPGWKEKKKLEELMLMGREKED